MPNPIRESSDSFTVGYDRTVSPEKACRIYKRQMKNVSIPNELADRVLASGADLRSFAVDAIEQKLVREAGSSSETVQERIARGWKLPTVKGKPRADGLAWSEVEAATDAA